MQESLSKETGSRDGSGWRSLLTWCTAGLIVLLLLVMFVFVGEIIPPLVLFVVMMAVGLTLLRRPGRAGPIVIGIAVLLNLLANLPFILPTLTVPVAAGDFVTGWILVILSVAGLIAAIALLRRSQDGGRSARSIGIATVGLIAVALLAGVVARASFEEPEAKPGDLRLAAEEFEFSSDALESEGGQVSVFLENKDQTFHTFTIEELDVDVAMPGGVSARVTFDAEPGTYDFFCSPHKEDMKGTLEIR